MREIKFRAWDQNHGWVFPVAVLSDGRVALSETFSPLGTEIIIADLQVRDDLIAVQYTGLKDKNGKEVYEGDLVAPTGGYEDGECEHPSEVHWNEYNLQWEALCKTCAEAVPLGEFDLHSVVGNVWES